ncbi:MAG: hypothetical protein HY246_24165 [Proteobacteria bacterium]|nr:hypothetical protein [Pseudomonadota bacterium]
MDVADNARERALVEFRDQQALDALSRHVEAERRRRHETEARIVRKIADQQHDPVSPPRRHLQRALNQRGANPRVAEAFGDDQRSEQQGRRGLVADRHRPATHGADNLPIDLCDQLQIGVGRDAVAEAVGRLVTPFRPECGVQQYFDLRPILGPFRGDFEHHGGSRPWTLTCDRLAPAALPPSRTAELLEFGSGESLRSGAGNGANNMHRTSSSLNPKSGQHGC